MNLCSTHSRLKERSVQLWNDTTKNDAITIVQRAFLWGVKHQVIFRNPIQSIPDKPRPKRREAVIDAEEWQKTYSLVDSDFRDLLEFLWETGCRPMEARTIESRHVDFDHGIVHFPPSEAKGTRYDRIIFLTSRAAEILKKYASKDGILLHNRDGQPWTKDAIKCRFARLEKKLGRRVCAYAIRHAYATEGLQNGFDSLVLAHLMGHQDTTMIARTYGHLAQESYLRIEPN